MRIKTNKILSLMVAVIMLLTLAIPKGGAYAGSISKLLLKAELINE